MDEKHIENKNFSLPCLLIKISYAIGTKVSVLLGLRSYLQFLALEILFEHFVLNLFQGSERRMVTTRRQSNQHASNGAESNGKAPDSPATNGTTGALTNGDAKVKSCLLRMFDIFYFIF